VAVLKKNGNEKLKKYINLQEDPPATVKFKKGIISRNKLDTPIFSWPKDKDSLLSIINTYLANLQLDKLEDTLDGVKEKKEKEPKVEKVEESQENAEGSENTEEKTEGEETPEEPPTEEKVEESTWGEEEIEYIDESEYAELPGQIYEIDNCSAKVLASVVRILNSRSKNLIKIRLMKKAKAPLDIVNEEVEKVVLYNVVLAKYLPILDNQKNIDVVTLKAANQLFEDVCVEGYEEIPTQTSIETEIKKNKEEQDFDIVSALAYCGVSVDKDDYGYYTIKGYNNGNGIKYFIGSQEKAFAISKNSCHKFVDNFLNKKIEVRKFITPGQVFITYIGEAEKSLGINTHSAVELSNLFGSVNNKNAKSYFKEVIKKYSRNAQEWKDFQKLFRVEYYANKESKDDVANKIHIKQQAKRLVVGELFSEFVNPGKILSDEQIGVGDYRISDITRDFGLDIDIDDMNVNKTRIDRLEDQAFRIINTMHGTLQEMKLFTQDIIDNYTVDYLRKEKIFLLQQDDQKEYIRKKKEYEDLIEKLSIDKGKDSEAQLVYYQQQIDELVQKIGNQEYRDAKNDLQKSKNTFRVLLLNAQTQKELVLAEIRKAEEDKERLNKRLTIEEKLDIVKEVLSSAPELIITFDKGKATSWTKHRVGEKATKREEKLSTVDKIIEGTAARISDESHQKILEENKIRESLKKAQKEERVKSVNAYINAYGSIVGNASGVGAYTGNIVPPDIAMNGARSNGPTFANSAGSGVVSISGANPSYTQNSVVPNAAPPLQTNGYNNAGGNSNGGNNGSGSGNNGGNAYSGGSSGAVGSANNGGYAGGNGGGMSQGGMVQPMGMPQMPMGGYPGMVGGFAPGMAGMPNFNKDYQNFDYINDSVEPCVIPFVVGYEDKGVTVYGNMMERYATFDRYKFLLSTNNNALYTYVEGKRNQVQSPEQIVSDLHIRYMKNAMAKSGLATLDSNLANFDYKGDVRKFVTRYAPQSMADMVVADYNDLVATVDFELLKDAIDHRFNGDLEGYIPDMIKEDITKAANLIATIVKAICQDKNVKRTYEEYSSKMKQSYIDNLITKIDKGDIPTVKLDSDAVYSRMLDYISFSVKGQNVIIQNEDEKSVGLNDYPRSIFFRQKENADKNIGYGRQLSYEQNELITTRNEPTLGEVGEGIINLFGTLYKFNGGFNKLLLKLKPYGLPSGVKFIENLIDALKEKIEIKTTITLEEDNKPSVPLVKFASKEKEKRENAGETIYDYDDDKWFIRKGFVLDKTKIKEYALLLAFGMKYGLDRAKEKLKEEFYKDNILRLNKINEVFKDMPETDLNILISVIRSVMMTNYERFIDYLDHVNDSYSIHINRMLYINRMLIESNTFDKKTRDEKIETIEILEGTFNKYSEDIKDPHPEIYSSIEEIEAYEFLHMYYALTKLFEEYENDERILCENFTEYYAETKTKMRSMLLRMIRDHEYMNGYEQELAKYYELNMEKVMSLDDKPTAVEEYIEEGVSDKPRIKIKNIDVIFKGIYDGFMKAYKNENNVTIQDEIDEIKDILEIVGTLPSIDSEEKELEIALPNNQTILCNIKGFMQQYLFRFIIDREHELGPFAYVVNELKIHEELGPIVEHLDEVADRLNAQELGINLIAKFSSITLSNGGNIFKIGDSITTVLETINRLKTPTDIQKTLNRDVFYKEGVDAVKKSFEQYFNRRKLENMKD